MVPASVDLFGEPYDFEKVQAGVFSLMASMPYFFGVRSIFLCLRVIVRLPLLNSVEEKYVLGLGVSITVFVTKSGLYNELPPML